ncbi:aromatic-ring-hydroxylating dioxygenase subunit beta [Polynucleobacter rarus]|uniref:aromatic-ring-hydroxylating dioxygenase subunit beta n=1 Tax=Polynucleobacter rarus TaxID=556055 RepID=UPI000D3EC1C1|nr:aromatic-ring-hydroxylating dioxygenase subunit beta [Polynucleobacter rarus]
MNTFYTNESDYRLVEQLIFEWARRIDENRVEEIADLLVPNGRYTVQSRFNLDRNLPHCSIDCHSPAQLRDRILSMRIANIYEPHHYRHMISGIQILKKENNLLEVVSNFSIIRTMELDGQIQIIFTGQARDEILIDQQTILFTRRHLVFDSRAIETLLVIPI